VHNRTYNALHLFIFYYLECVFLLTLLDRAVVHYTVIGKMASFCSLKCFHLFILTRSKSSFNSTLYFADDEK